MEVKDNSNSEQSYSVFKKFTSFQLGKEKKMKFSFPWKRAKSIDYDNSEKIDEFIQAVIERAKQEYLLECSANDSDEQHVTNGHGELMDIDPPVSDDDENDENNPPVPTNERINLVLGQSCDNMLNNGNHTEKMAELDRSPAKNVNERKPLLEKRRGIGCFQHLKTVLCCQCICNSYEVT